MRRPAFSHSLCSVSAALLLSALFAQPARSAPEVERSPAPAWVTAVPLPESGREVDKLASGGVVRLLVDEQRNEVAQTTYDHFARKFTNANGVQDATAVTVDFAPAYQKLILHQLVVHRDGAAIDRLPMARIRVLDREQGMDGHVYDGFVTASIDVEDVRVGDTLEYAYSITGNNPVFAGVFSDFVYSSWPAPIVRFQYRLLWPKDRYVGTKVFSPGPKLDFTKTEAGDLVEYLWSARDIPAADADGEVPDWYSPYGRIQVSGYRDWSQVVDWALDFYSVDTPLPPSIQKEVDRLREKEDPESRIVGALEYVQNNFRYLSNAEGVHSHRPYPIEEVVARGFGDCKDKARLLTAMLRALDFTAYPALVQSTYRQEIADWLPSPLDFDHVIVALTLDHRHYWLDPTRDHQSGKLAERYGPAYGKALVIQSGEIGLTNVALSGRDQAEIVRDTSLRISAYSAPVTMQIRTVYTGRDADWERALLASVSPAEAAKSRLNRVAREYAGVQSKTGPTFDDQIADNRIVSDESYTVSKFWQPRTESTTRLFCEVYPYLIKDLVDPPGTQIRTSPLALAYPKKIRQSFVLHLPEKGNFPNEDFQVDDPAFRYSSTTRLSDRTLTISYTFESLAESVPTDRVPEYLENLRKARENLGYSLNVPKQMVEGGPAAPIPPGALNWPILMLEFFFVLIGLAVAIGLFLWRPKWPPKPANPKYAGLSGWLIVIALGLFFRPLLTLFNMRDSVSFLNLDVWNNFTSPGQPHYDPTWAPVLLMEMFFTTALVIFSLLLIVLFFQKRRTFPPLFVGMVASILVYSIADSIAESFMAKKFPDLPLDSSPKQVMQAIFQAAIWIPYMLVSQRIHATFIK